jgi:hypothetical protein
MFLMAHLLALFGHLYKNHTMVLQLSQHAGLLPEAFELRDGTLELRRSQLSLTSDDVNDIINFICICI